MSDSTTHPSPRQEVLAGFCQCGCGQKTKIAHKTYRKLGWVKGQPIHYIHGHNPANVSPPLSEELTQPRLCLCGCGEEVPPAKRTNKRDGLIKGIPSRYIHGHNARPTEPYTIDHTTNCWVWKRCKNNGYGVTTGYKNGKKITVSAHRFYYEKHKGPIPPGKEIDHLCHNPSCVNPDHLEAVSRATNMRRRRTGKITEEIAIEIKQLRRAGLLLREIAKQLNIPLSVVRDVSAGATWQDV